MFVLKKQLNIVIIGTGNVATQLALTLFKQKHKILQVAGRTKRNATELASKVKAEPITDLKKINSTADLFIVAVKDDAIERVVSQLKLKNKIIVHTSGSVNASVLKKVSLNYGVFYPLQTISKNRSVNFREVPVCIEYSNSTTEKLLFALASSLSDKVYKINSSQRKMIHLAAVFACNFTNQMYAIGEELLKENELSFEILKPLIAETAEKIKNNKPSLVQTGPAVREDKKTMKEHLKLLKDKRSLQKLYRLVSEEIIKTKK